MTASNAASLPVPVWAELVGGTDEAAWVADRHRKFRLATALRAEVLSAKAAIEGASGDLFVCTPQALAAHPFAADWYISLSAYALKTLGNIHVRPKSYGLDRSAKGVVEFHSPRTLALARGSAGRLLSLDKRRDRSPVAIAD